MNLGRLRRPWPVLDPRALRVLLVGGTSYLARGASAVAVLVTVPLARQALAPELFGVWMMLSALIVFFSFSDLGVGNGVLNRITAAHATGRRDECDRIVIAGYLCTGTTALVFFGVWLAWSTAASQPTAVAGPISAAHRSEVLAALHVFAALVAINIPASLIQKIQLGSQEGHWVGMTQFCASIATLLAVPAALALGGGLVMLVLAALGMQVLGNVVNSLLWLRHSGMLRRLGHTRVEYTDIAHLLRVGSLFFVLQLSAAFAFHSDAIVITRVLGQAAYGDFAAIQRLFLAVSALLGAGLIGLWPAFGDAIARNDVRWLKSALRRSLSGAALLAGFVSAVLVASMGPITSWWLQMPEAPPLAMTLVLAAWTVVESLAVITGAILNAAGLLRAQVLVAVALSVTAFAAKWALVAAIGAHGAVLATLLAYAAISIPAQVLILRRYFEGRQRGRLA